MLGDERPPDASGNAEDNAGTVDRPRRGRPPGKLGVVVQQKTEAKVPKEKQVVQGFTIDQVLELLNHQSVENQKNLLLAIQELKKPSPEEQAKLDQEHRKLKERAAAAVKVAMAEEQGKENAAKFCPHGTTHKGTHVFTHQWRAQVMTPDGEKPYYIPRCTQCGSTWDRVYGLPSPKLLASTDQMTQGVNMDQWSDQDIERVVEWAKRNPVAEEVTA